MLGGNVGRVLEAVNVTLASPETESTPQMSDEAAKTAAGLLVSDPNKH